MHDPALPECPFLPPVDELLTAAVTRRLGGNRGPDFYESALAYAHSLWRRGYPARALLLINRAMGCALEGDEPVLQRWPIPYDAVAWILTHRLPGQFIGNPRRHWQHLATRMVPPRKDLRAWRAWACWHLARLAMPDLPADEAQLRDEGIREPPQATILRQLETLGHPGEAPLWAAVVRRLDALGR